MNQKITTKLMLCLFFLLVLINYLTASAKIPGLSPQKDISNLYDTPITPAGFAFSIWAVIYLLLFAALLHMIKQASTDVRPEFITKITRYLLLLFSFNLAWNVVFGLGLIAVSFILIIGYLISLIMIGLILADTKEKVSPIMPLAFGIHTGWISIASIVNLYAYFVQIKFSAFIQNKELWVIIAISFVLLLVALLLTKLKNAAIPLATAWAFWGIYAKEGIVFSQYTFIPQLLLLGILLLIGFSITVFFKNGKCLLPKRI